MAGQGPLKSLGGITFMGVCSRDPFRLKFTNYRIIIGAVNDCADLIPHFD